MLPLSEVQTIIREQLTAVFDPLSVPVLDQAGPNQQFPYVTLGEFVGGESDTLGEESVDLTMTIHCWSRQRGMGEIQTHMELVKDTINRKRFPATGFQWVDTVWEYAQTLREADGETRHGVLRFRIGCFAA